MTLEDVGRFVSTVGFPIAATCFLMMLLVWVIRQMLERHNKALDQVVASAKDQADSIRDGMKSLPSMCRYHPTDRDPGGNRDFRP